jgi:cytoskeleton protein RodZ
MQDSNQEQTQEKPDDLCRLSFGRYLKAVREQQGIELKQVSEITRVGMDALMHIEAEDHARLPEEVFVKGFLRAYAKAVGADGNDVIGRYLASRHETRSFSRSKTNRIRTRPKFWPRFLMVLVLLAGVGIGSFYGLSYLRQRLSDGLPVHPDVATPAQAPAAPADQAVKEANPVSKRLELKVETLEKTRLKVVIDGQTSKEFRLQTGDRLDLEATKGFNLLVDSATAVRLALNGKPIKISGRKGQAVNIQIP